MGYTHYWAVKDFTDTQWSEFQAHARKVFRRAARAGIKIRGWDGTGSPEVSADRIAFNGADDEGHETCSIKRTDTDRDFCKTARKPYDTVVVALLTIGARMGCMEWSSDGDPEDHADGVKLARDLP